MRGVVVAMDLETTGLNPETGSIIEIGAAKMEGDEVVAEFQTLVYPGGPIPPRVMSLTGITDADVRDAPRLPTVLPKLNKFIGDAPVLGHNIEFDINFLASAGLRLKNPLIDTYMLASVILPSTPRYNLAALAEVVGEHLDDAHRAYADALMSYRVYRHLWQMVLALPEHTILEIATAGRQMPWGAEAVFDAALLTKKGQGEANTVTAEELERDLDDLFDLEEDPDEFTLSPKKNPKSIDIGEVASILEPNGALSQAVDYFEFRPEQVEMLEAVASMLNESEHALIEAPTGVGKSLAYLIPAIKFATENNERVVVSTNTINLQSQLMNKDIPLLQEKLGLDFRAAVLKGKGNYLCPRRLLALRRRAPTSVAEMQLLAKILIWLRTERSGDKENITLRGPVEQAIWRRLSAEDEGCTLGRCSSQMFGSCPFYRARKAADAAHVLIVNHALLLSDSVSEGKIIPDYRYVIIDEAHHLEDAVTNSISYRIDMYTLHRRIAELGTANSGFLGDLLRACQGAIPDKYFAIISEFVHTIANASDAMKQHVEWYFDVIQRFLEDNARVDNTSGYSQQIRIVDALRQKPGWTDVERQWDNLSKFTAAIANAMEELSAGLLDLEDYGIDQFPDLVAAASASARHYMEIHAFFEQLSLKPDANRIYWAEFRPDGSRVILHSAPLDVGPLTEEHLWNTKHSVIMASATLRTAGTFAFIKNRLNAEQLHEIVIDSPFNYRENTLVYLVDDIPEPRQYQDYQRAVESGIHDIARAAGGRTLALFTSFSQLRQTAKNLAAPFADAGITIYDQTEGMSRTQLLEGFVASERAVLMGTRSFWEGVDVPGEDLSVLAITKLPFNVPSDPIFASRSEAVENAFFDYAIPDTILRFRQGFGRLIRRTADYGVVVIFDRRLISKSYGTLFLESLPECTIQRGPLDGLADATVKWLAKHQS